MSTTKELIKRITLLEATAIEHGADSDSYSRLMQEAREERDELRLLRAKKKGQKKPITLQFSYQPNKCPNCGIPTNRDGECYACMYRGRERCTSCGTRIHQPGQCDVCENLNAKQSGPQEGDYGTYTRNCTACGKRFTNYSYHDKCLDCVINGTRRKPRCGYCGKTGHNKSSCPDNPNKKGHRYSDTQYDFSYEGSTCGTHTKSKWGPKICDCGSKVTGKHDKNTGIREVYCRSSHKLIFISPAIHF